MAHHLVTQVEEDTGDGDSTRIPLGPLVNSAGSGIGSEGRRGGVSGESQRRVSPPQGCWATVMSYFGIGPKAQQQQLQQQQQQQTQQKQVR